MPQTLNDKEKETRGKGKGKETQKSIESSYRCRFILALLIDGLHHSLQQHERSEFM